MTLLQPVFKCTFPSATSEGTVTDRYASDLIQTCAASTLPDVKELCTNSATVSECLAKCLEPMGTT